MVAIEEGEDLGRGVYRIKDLVEKPRREDAPSNLAIIGRYILTPDIFPALEATARDRTGEIQLTNGLRRLLRDRPDLCLRNRGRAARHRQQARLPEGAVYFAMRRPELAEPFRRYLETLDLKIGVGSEPDTFAIRRDRKSRAATRAASRAARCAPRESTGGIDLAPSASYADAVNERLDFLRVTRWDPSTRVDEAGLFESLALLDLRRRLFESLPPLRRRRFSSRVGLDCFPLRAAFASALLSRRALSDGGRRPSDALSWRSP